MTFPDFLEQIIVERALGREAAEQIRHGPLPRKLLEPAARCACEMSRLFTQQRDQLPQRYLKKRSRSRGWSRDGSEAWSARSCDLSPTRAGYLLYFFPINFPKIQALLRELSLHPTGLLNKPSLRVLDIGCGPGTALLGTLDYFYRADMGNEPGGRPPSECGLLQFVALDRLHENLADCQWLVSRYVDHMREDAGRASDSSLRVELETFALDMERVSKGRISKLLAPGGRYDLIILSNALNELFCKANDPIGRRAELLRRLSDDLLEADGSLVVVEPALRTTSRDLLAVRDLLVSSHGLSVYSPCIDRGTCPLLAEGRDRDWCHAVHPYQRPTIVAQMDRLIGSRNDTLKFSYAIARKDGKKLGDGLHCDSPSMWRAVGDMARVKGQSYVWMCGAGGFKKHVLLDRDLSHANAPFQKIQRGTVARIEDVLEEGDTRRLRKESSVKTYSIDLPSRIP